MSTPAEVVTPNLLRSWPLPAAGTSKHGRGHVLVIGGSRTTPGAAQLAGLAALRVGAGVLALAVPNVVAIPLAVAVPESAVFGFDQAPEQCWSDDQLTHAVQNADCSLLGPGLNNAELTAALLQGLASRRAPTAPVVLDAFALGVLPDNRACAEACRDALVMSPNRTEAARLLEVDEDRLPDDEETIAYELAATYDAVVTFQSVVMAPGAGQWRVDAGHPGLGTSGSGDVLAGAITGLLARGASVAQAAVWATYLHASAGDRLAARVGRLGFLARELLDELPHRLLELHD